MTRRSSGLPEGGGAAAGSDGGDISPPAAQEPAALPVAVLHLFLAHEAARPPTAGGASVAEGTREGASPPLPRLAELPPRPPPPLRAVLLHLLRLLAQLLRALPRGAHMLPAVATLARCGVASEEINERSSLGE